MYSRIIIESRHRGTRYYVIQFQRIFIVCRDGDLRSQAFISLSLLDPSNSSSIPCFRVYGSCALYSA